LTFDVLVWSVVQVIVAPVLVIALTAMLLITGAGATVVVNVPFDEVADVPLPFAETTSKSYSVPPVSPVSVTEWLVTKAVFTVVAVP
jgi:hypothetical protein